MTLVGSYRFLHFLTANAGKSRNIIFINSSRALSTKSAEAAITDAVCPQGIQGDNDANIKVWWKTCHRYGLENCEQQLQGIESGRKTLHQVLAEQDALIQEIAETYKHQVNRQGNDSVQGIQDLIMLPSMDAPCPQGVQGSECAQFKVWLQNCHRFGFQNCLDQFENIKTGQKKLADIFREQELLIQSVVQQYKQTRSYSTTRRGYSTRSYSTRSYSTRSSSADGLSTRSFSTSESQPINDTIAKSKNQKDRLKQAIRDYGSTVIIFHIGISLISLGGFYFAVSSGIDMVAILSKIGVADSILQSNAVAGAGTFVVAYAVHKMFAPARIAITLTSTPLIVRYLRKIGFLKTIKAK